WNGGPTSYVAQWVRCDADGTSDCNPITAYRDSSVYTPVVADAGHTLRVRWIAHNAAGDSNAAESAPTGVVTTTVPMDIQAPSIKNSTSPTVGTKLGADPGR